MLQVALFGMVIQLFLRFFFLYFKKKGRRNTYISSAQRVLADEKDKFSSVDILNKQLKNYSRRNIFVSSAIIIIKKQV